MQSCCLGDPKEDMALRKEEKEWVLTAIGDAIKEHLNPHGWQKLVYWLRLLGPLVGTIGLLPAPGELILWQVCAQCKWAFLPGGAPFL